MKQYQKEAVNVQKYAVAVSGLPKQGVTVDQVRNFFSKYGPIHEIVMGRSVRNYLNDYNEEANLQIQIASCIIKMKEQPTQNKCLICIQKILIFLRCLQKQKDLETLEKEYEELKKQRQENIQNKQYNEDKNNLAKVFIIFEQVASKVKCVDDYKNTSFFTYFQSEKLRWEGKYSLSVREAQDPSVIFWENIETSYWKGKIFSTIVTLTSMLIIGCSLVIVYAINQAQDEDFPSDTQCLQYYSNVNKKVSKNLKVKVQDFTYDQAYRTYKDNTDTIGYYCWCSQQDVKEILKGDSPTADLCHD